jgi:hypothetical protein
MIILLFILGLILLDIVAQRWGADSTDRINLEGWQHHSLTWTGN